MSTRNKKRPHFSIKFHILSTMIALTVIMLAILWALQGIFFDTIFKLTKESDVRRASGLISENIESNDIASLISKVAVEYNICLKVYDPVDEIDIYDEHFLNDCALHRLDSHTELFHSWYEKALENDGEYSEIFPLSVVREYFDSDFDEDLSKNEAKECVFSTRLVSDDDGNVYMLIINAPIAPMTSTTRIIRIILIIVSVIFCVISLLISYILTRRLSKPIEKITESARNLKIGDYNVRFEENGPIEVMELAKTLNSTATQLDNADRLQKELIANISHDLRTPLTMISGYSEVMRDIPGENTPENMQVIIDETARLNSLVNDLLDVSKLQSGTHKINIQRISLTKAIRDTVKRYERLTSHNGYKITFVCENDEEIFVNADETRLLQVVYNLINNAINYTGEDKCVTVRQDVLDDTVRISVIDTGEGISEENLPLIWDRYYKVDKVHKRAILGTGLGLSIVKNILLLHNSRFGVSSEVGTGSVFWFEFKIV